MGCDIHMYIEYANRRIPEKRWADFGGKINPGRNYSMFGILSKGLRTTQEFSFEPKGLPYEMGYHAVNDSRIPIGEHGEGWASKDKVARWVNSGASEIIRNENGDAIWVTNPDWHSHSWLTTDEYKQAVTFYNDVHGKAYPEPEYNAVLACLESFEAQGFDARIVFWFDN